MAARYVLRNVRVARQTLRLRGWYVSGQITDVKILGQVCWYLWYLDNLVYFSHVQGILYADTNNGNDLAIL